MKLLLVGIANLFPEHVAVAEELTKRHEIPYWVRIDTTVAIDQSRFPHTIFHRYHDALAGIPARGFDASRIEPLSAERIAEYAGAESELMSMMEKWCANWPINKRKEFYYDLLAYWSAVLDRCKPEAIVFAEVPHQMFTFVLYTLAKRRMLRTIMHDIVLEHDRLIIYRDYTRGNETLLAQEARGFSEFPASLENLLPKTREYFLKVSGTPNPTPRYSEEFYLTHTPWLNFKRRVRALKPFLKDGSIVERGVLWMFKRMKQNARDEYKRFEQAADMGCPFIYVPLQQQPELTTSPQGGIFVDQLLMVKMLAAALPEGWQLYVKEHPGQWAAHGPDYMSLRYPGFYEALAKIPNTRLVPVTTNTFELTDRAKAVATITGSAAWEAVLRGKCALIFGYPWYMHAPGLFRVKSPAECRDALREIAKGQFPTKEDILKYLAALDHASFRGYLTSNGKRVSTYQGDDQWRDMYEAIEKELES